MNKLMNNIITLGKSFYGLVVYFAVAFIFSYIIKSIPNITYFQHNIILIIEETITLLLLIIVFRKRLKKDFIDFDKNYKKYLSFGIKVWIAGILIMIVSNNVIYHFITSNIAYNQEANIAIMNNYPLYAVLSMVIAGPFIEETVFRLSFKNVINNKKLYYILTILIFTSLHVLNGITNPLQLLFFIPYGSLAFALTYILDKTDNIFTTIILHTLHNALTVILIALTSFI